MSLIARIGALIVQVLNNGAARGLAMKLFLKGLIITVIPLAILTAINLVMGTMIDWIITKVDAVSVSEFTATQLTGIGAYLFAELGLNTACSAILSGLSIKMVLRSIPFLKL